MMITLRPLMLPNDYAGMAALLNTYWSEPTTAERLEEDDTKLFEVGVTSINEAGLLVGYDRTRRVAVTEDHAIVGYVWSWRAPWTEPGFLNNTIVVGESHRRQGIGELLYQHVLEWGKGLGATMLVTEVWDDSPEALQFAESRGFAIERHGFQSILRMEKMDMEAALDMELFRRLADEGLRLTTLAEEAEAGGDQQACEQKLYELYKETLANIPGFTGDVPVYQEWLKWYLKCDGFTPDGVMIAADGERYVGVSNVIHNLVTNGMYHEYTGVCGEYRRRGIARALKSRAIALAKARGASYLKTDNDSTNAPILRINRSLGFEPLRGSYRMIAEL